MRYFFIAVAISFVFSCKDSKKETLVSNIATSFVPLVAAQSFETATADLLLNKDSLLRKKIKSYTANQTQSGTQKTKFYYHALEHIKGKLISCELHGKDTIISERIMDSKPNLVSYEKSWHQINRKVTRLEFERNGFNYQVERDKNQIDSIKIKKVNNSISRIDFPNRGDKEIHSKINSNKELVTYIKRNGDTLFQYESSFQNGNLVSKIYKKGLRHQYSYSYQNQLLTQIVWKENSTKTNAIIDFEYDSNGLLKRRIIKSNIPAFGNTETVYSFQN